MTFSFFDVFRFCRWLMYRFVIIAGNIGGMFALWAGITKDHWEACFIGLVLFLWADVAGLKEKVNDQ